jgi:hypothetical protein
MRLPRNLVIDPANTPAAVAIAQLAERNNAQCEQLWRQHEAHLKAVYSRLYPDHLEPFAVLRKIRGRRGLK